MKNKKSKVLLIVVIALVAILAVVMFSQKDVKGPAEDEKQECLTDYIAGVSEGTIFILDAASEEKTIVNIAEITGEIFEETLIFNKEQTKLLYSNNLKEVETDIYTKDIYVYDIEAKSNELILDGVCDFYTNEDFSAFVYEADDRSIWYKENTSEAEKIAEDCYYFNVSDDLQQVIYEGESAEKYLYTHGADTKLIGKDIELISNIDGSFLYNEKNSLVKYDNGEKTVLIENSGFEYGSWVDKDAFFTVLGKEIDISGCLEYDIPESEYAEVHKNIISKINEGKMVLELYNVYYYDGEKVTLVTENVLSCLRNENYYDDDFDQYVGVYYMYNENALPKIKLSEINPDYEFYFKNEVLDRCKENADIAVTYKDKFMGEIDINSGSAYIYDEEHGVLYIKDQGYDDEESLYINSIYAMELTEDKLGEVEVIADSIKSHDDVFAVCSDGLVYTKASDDFTSELYAGKTLITPNCINTTIFENDAFYTYNSSEDIDGDEKSIVYIDGVIQIYDGINSYQMFDMTKGGRVICSQDEDGTIAILENGVATEINGVCIDYILVAN